MKERREVVFYHLGKGYFTNTNGAPNDLWPGEISAKAIKKINFMARSRAPERAGFSNCRAFEVWSRETRRSTHRA